MGQFWYAAAVTVIASAGMAGAQGFAVTDLTEVEVDTSAFDTGAFETLPKPKRLMVACLECSRTAVVNLRLGSADPETEQNLRDGTMTQDVLGAACTAAQGSVTCLGVELVTIGDAVGWMTRTRAGENRQLMTYELFLGGQKLSVQAIAESRDEADAIGRTAFDTIVPTIVGVSAQ